MHVPLVPARSHLAVHLQHGHLLAVVGVRAVEHLDACGCRQREGEGGPVSDAQLCGRNAAGLPAPFRLHALAGSGLRLTRIPAAVSGLRPAPSATAAAVPRRRRLTGEGAGQLAAAGDPGHGGALVKQVHRVKQLLAVLHDQAHAQDLALLLVGHQLGGQHLPGGARGRGQEAAVRGWQPCGRLASRGDSRPGDNKKKGLDKRLYLPSMSKRPAGCFPHPAGRRPAICSTAPLPPSPSDQASPG